MDIPNLVSFIRLAKFFSIVQIMDVSSRSYYVSYFFIQPPINLFKRTVGLEFISIRLFRVSSFWFILPYSHFIILQLLFKYSITLKSSFNCHGRYFNPLWNYQSNEGGSFGKRWTFVEGHGTSWYYDRSFVKSENFSGGCQGSCFKPLWSY